MTQTRNVYLEQCACSVRFLFTQSLVSILTITISFSDGIEFRVGMVTHTDTLHPPLCTNIFKIESNGRSKGDSG